MPANTSPIFTKAGAIGAVRITAGNSKTDGTGTIGTDIFLGLTANATNGSFVQRVRFSACNTSAGTAATTTATVGRVYLSTQSSGSTTASNTHLWGEISLPAVATDGDSATPTAAFEIPLNFVVPSGYSVLVTNGVSPASNTEWKAIVIAGDY